MAIAAGVPMPKVYIIDDPSPNAFATGRDPQHSSVAVTTGLLQQAQSRGAAGRHRPRDVARPQLRHPLHADRRRAWSAASPCWPSFFLRYTFWFGGGRRGNDREGGGGGLAIVLLVVGLVMAIVSYFFGGPRPDGGQPPARVPGGRFVRGADPQPARAGERPGQDLRRTRSRSHSANGATQHLYIVNPLKKLGGGSDLFSTHPPIVDRINRLRQLTGDAPMDPAETRLSERPRVGDGGVQAASRGGGRPAGRRSGCLAAFRSLVVPFPAPTGSQSVS